MRDEQRVDLWVSRKRAAMNAVLRVTRINRGFITNQQRCTAIKEPTWVVERTLNDTKIKIDRW